MKKLGMIATPLVLALAAASFASVPPAGKTTGDTAIYQDNSQITTPRVGRLNFDRDLKNLNEMEKKYHEQLPRLADRPELASPIKRISTRKYKAKQQRAGKASAKAGPSKKTVQE